jgi:hypothetical protein
MYAALKYQLFPSKWEGFSAPAKQNQKKPSPIPKAIYPKLTMESEGGSAFDSVSASVLGPAPVGEPASKGGPQAEFDVPDRISLLTTLKNTLNADLPPTIWACLWLSDIDKLKELVDAAKQQPLAYHGYLTAIESHTKIVQKCEVYRLPHVLVT